MVGAGRLHCGVGSQRFATGIRVVESTAEAGKHGIGATRCKLPGHAHTASSRPAADGLSVASILADRTAVHAAAARTQHGE